MTLLVEKGSDQTSTEMKGQAGVIPGSPAPTAQGADSDPLRLTLAESLRAPKMVQRTPVQSDSSSVQPKGPSVQPEGPSVQPEGPSVQTEATPPPPEKPPVHGPLLYEEPLPGTGKTAPGGPRAIPSSGKKAKKAETLHTLALIIDDLGYEWPIAKAIIDLPADITLAILPKLPYSREIAKWGKTTGRELLLHQPMEPHRYPHISPGPGAMLAWMDREGLQAVLRSNLDQLPEVVGINNHMGSRLTENGQAMDAVMAVLAEKQLFFIDSRTSEGSVGAQRAAVGHVPTAVRDVFIDNKPNEEAILRQLAQLERLAHSHGEVIGIGHPYRATLAALQRWLPTLPQKGIILTRVSRFIRPVAARAHYPDHHPVVDRDGHRDGHAVAASPPNSTPGN